MSEIENKEPVEKDPENDPLVLYLIVKESLGMTAGKIGAQTGHAVGMIYEKLHTLKKQQEKTQEVLDKLNIFESWRNENYRKVVLRASDKEWEKLKTELECFLVRDAGYTQVPAGSETVIGLWPQKKSQVSKSVKRLQVLK